jgi:hypothetical protein
MIVLALVVLRTAFSDMDHKMAYIAVLVVVMVAVSELVLRIRQRQSARSAPSL